MLVVNAFSRWLEFLIVSFMSAATVLREMRRRFTTYGIFDVVVTDSVLSFGQICFRSSPFRMAFVKR